MAGLPRRHRILRLSFALAAGLALAWLAWESDPDPETRQMRKQEEAVVLEARRLLREQVAAGSALEIVDPLAPAREIGKVFVYPAREGWEVSGYYRRVGARRWHPWLMHLSADRSLLELAVQDDEPALAERAASDERLKVSPSSTGRP